MFETTAIDRTVRLVSIRFAFSRSAVVPPSVALLTSEPKRNIRKGGPNGTMVINPLENCSGLSFIGELMDAGYELVNTVYDRRPDDNDPSGRRIYHTVRFMFARSEFVDISDEFRSIRDNLLKDLRIMMKSAMWRIRAFSNPFFDEKGDVSPDFSSLNVNCEVRKPFFQPCGSPIVVWERDENDNKIGEKPIPVRQDYDLRIVDDEVTLVAA